ncbi:MAG: AbrB/MazE/SpoVT family DNA-binding domain-containing protein [Candidatus Woesearchaeota archaeon]
MNNSRSIQKVGNRSYAISLPKEWITLNKLKEKDDIFFEKTKDNKIILSTHNSKQESKDITISVDTINNISEFIMLCYVKSVDNILLTSKNFNYEKTKKIREIVTHLEGYNIVFEDEKTIKISFMFNDIKITTPQTIKRMFYLLKILLESIENNDLKTASETENAIDRLYHLSKRILLSCIRDSDLRKENNIVNDEDIFFTKDVVKKLEGIGDSIYELTEITPKKEDIERIKKILQIIEHIIVENKSVEQELQKLESITNKHLTRSDLIIGKIIDRSKDIIENMMSIEFNKKYF